MDKPFSVLIVGGGTAGWMAANLMAKYWHGQGVEIALLESDQIGTIGVGEGSTPYLKSFFRTLEIPESEWMPACNATYKCGIRFPNWSTATGYESYYHPFFSPLDREVGMEFFRNANLRRSGLDVPANPTDFFHAPFLSASARAPVAAQPMPFEMDYGYHFDAGLLGAFLREKARSLGVRHIVDTVEHVERDGDRVVAVRAASAGHIEADFFVDCTGFRAMLIGGMPGYRFREFSDTLYNNAAVTVQVPRDDDAPLISETVSEAMSAGWMWRIPLQTRTGCGYVYSDRFISADQAGQELREKLGLADETRLNHVKMRVGRTEQHWHGNCLAVGLSQGFIEPLEATALMLVQFTIERFLERFEPGTMDSAICREQQGIQEAYNLHINELFDGVLDYVAAHYALNNRDDTPYWRAAREEIHISERLRAILAVWDGDSDFDAMLEREGAKLIYSGPSWYCLLAGMGRFPVRLKADPARRGDSIDAVRAFCESNLPRFRPHQQQLEALEQQ
ncbi:tryptophan halogenase family protein [Biformimicrobium ophioploci]|uniref:Tryptophan 7-halogenase n=1 Tax=Biformimicrobium ophioploci TaxID=3036711 RepID=A0ABQ6LV60_9GAMM|nr:tryptophan halogenase family protein [Microbulbifer sp. NKW57]GMG85978.1 tryptophan 7-halogenase [Microbulbifer sp. NKW57]